MSHSNQSIANSIEELTAFTSQPAVWLSELTELRIFELSGEDASAFLQGQFCNDLAQASSTQAQITGYCTPKGRLLALPTLVGFENGFRLIVPSDVADPFIKRLSMFVMRSKVVITELTDWSVIGLTLQESDNDLTEHLGALPVGSYSVSTSDSAQLIRCHDDRSASYSGSSARTRFLRIAENENQQQLISSLPDVKNVTDHAWRLSDISAGVPSITSGVVEAFVPQMINLQLIDGLSFTKGCYPGQEIVARMQYLGKLKRHMRVFSMHIDEKLDIDTALAAGATLHSGDDANAGVVVDAMPVSGSRALVLAVTKVMAEADFSLAGKQLEVFEMPYSLPSLEVA